ncbi:Mss4-like protein [Crucibulum laeve]|uniref:Mss4-like protein n=1 Tax=Crucibulum laeve TaxID=68775 RepID=A0A5C3LNL8_9AGAR|nr:Mss4-like protein [Crucibulum laeve]
MPRYSMEKGTETIPLGWKAYENVGKELKDDDTVDFYCNCRNIHLTVTRPNEESSNLWAAYPDLLKPYDTTLLSKIRNPGDEKWWLCYPVGGKAMKYLAGHCACNNCRLTSGFPIQSWAFVPRTNVIDKHTGTIIDLRGPSRPECLRQYIFAPGKYSEFCKVCGATVFTWGNQRPGLIVISMGLVNQDKEGARAERWLDWVKERVSFSEVALTQPIIHALEQGLRESRLEDLQGKQAD